MALLDIDLTTTKRFYLGDLFIEPPQKIEPIIIQERTTKEDSIFSQMADKNPILRELVKRFDLIRDI
jgi:hypothetical protein